MTIKYISIFSGIEAASVAWEPIGYKPIGFSEIDEFPSAVLKHHYPNVPNYGDITKVDWGEVIEKHGSPDVLVGGSPCQSFSVAAGRRRDSLDGKSRLMFEYVRACAFAQLVHSLQECGYIDLAWRVFDAQFFGVAQRRRRVYLVGHLGAGGASAAVLFERESMFWNIKTSKEKRKELTERTKRSFNKNLDSTVIVRTGHTGANGSNVSTGGLAYTLSQSNDQAVACVTPWDSQSKRIYSPNSCSPTLSSGSNEGKNIQPIIFCRASDSSNAETCKDISPTLTAHNAKGSPIVYLSNGKTITDKKY